MLKVVYKDDYVSKPFNPLELLARVKSQLRRYKRLNLIEEKDESIIEELALFVSGLNNVVFTSYLNWYSMWAIGQFSLLRTINTLFMVLSYGAVFFTAGYYFFNKREI